MVERIITVIRRILINSYTIGYQDAQTDQPQYKTAEEYADSVLTELCKEFGI